MEDEVAEKLALEIVRLAEKRVFAKVAHMQKRIQYLENEVDRLTHLASDSRLVVRSLAHDLNGGKRALEREACEWPQHRQNPITP